MVLQLSPVSAKATPQGDDSPWKSEAELVPLLSDPDASPRPLSTLTSQGAPEFKIKDEEKEKLQGCSCSGGKFLRSSCEQVHLLSHAGMELVRTATLHPRAKLLCMSLRSPLVKPRQGPQRDKYKGPEVGPSPAGLLLHPVEPERDGSVCYLSDRPTCFHQEKASAQCRTLCMYLLLTIFTQCLPQRCLGQSGPRLTDQACPLPSFFTNHAQG